MKYHTGDKVIVREVGVRTILMAKSGVLYFDNDNWEFAYNCKMFEKKIDTDGLYKHRIKTLQLKTRRFVKSKIKRLKCSIILENDIKISFKYKDGIVNFFIRSKSYNGDTITNGRGVNSLLKQIRR